MEQKERIRIISLDIENIMRIKAAHIEPRGNMVCIGGRNAQGKSSAINSIWYALGGKGAIPDRPVHGDQKKGKVEIELSNGLFIRRSITMAGGGGLSVSYGKTGKGEDAPQTILNAFYGDNSFDPLQFINDDPKKQAETLRKLVGIDFTELNERRNETYKNRADVNRDLGRAKARLDAMTLDEDAPAEEISLARLNEELKQALAAGETNQAIRYELRRQCEVAEAKRKRIEELKNELARAESDLIIIDKRVDALTADAQAIDDPDIDGIREQIASADVLNRRVRNNQSYHLLRDEVVDLSKKHDFLESEINRIDAEKKSLLLESSLPIEGLFFDEEGVTYNDMPLKQASDAEKLRVALAVGLALYPESGLILIRNGSLLDEDNLALIERIATEAGAQVFIERVGNGAECQVIIEDGLVKETREEVA